ncbi:MAG TPA: MBL fold metallo-hydrolase, partial [Xanthomonadales bacterium]|nr:MBL fold metallo-hydrolase [Xanthomonadales bacterium]
PDVGTARCDFPGGDAATLYRSIERLLALPDDTVIWLCHDYPPKGREPTAATTVGAERARNPHLAGRSAAEFVNLRTERDATLPAPQLLWPSLQVNIRGGRLPPPAANGVVYLKVPVQVR